jgi:cytochrome c oxidase cbb3-type subunit 3
MRSTHGMIVCLKPRKHSERSLLSSNVTWTIEPGLAGACLWLGKPGGEFPASLLFRYISLLKRLFAVLLQHVNVLLVRTCIFTTWSINLLKSHLLFALTDRPIPWLAALFATVSIAYTQTPSSQQNRNLGSVGSQGPLPVHEVYTPAVVESGSTLFVRNCAFCHGKDAGGGETGPDLTRSKLVSSDFKGEGIGPVILMGRPQRGMPRFDIPDEQVTSLVAFIHHQQDEALSQKGTRKGVDTADLQTGNVDAGKQYFNGAGTCSKCHVVTGDLAGVASRYQGLQLEEQMLAPKNVRPKVTVSLASGKTVLGVLAYRDEFTIGLVDQAGIYRSWPASSVKYEVNDPVKAHIELLGKYTDDDIHNLFAYIQTLR